MKQLTRNHAISPSFQPFTRVYPNEDSKSPIHRMNKTQEGSPSLPKQWNIIISVYIEESLMKSLVVPCEANPIKPPHLITENEKIIKLIHQKKYPLHLGQKSGLIFPKIREQYHRANSNQSFIEKKYVEIDLKEEGMGRTDLEQEVMHRYMNSSKNTMGCETIKKEKLSGRQIDSNDQPVKKFNMLNQSCHSFDGFPMEQEEGDYLKGYRLITKEAEKNSIYLGKLRESIDTKKKSYLTNLKFSQAIDEINDKENCSFEYIVNRLANKRGKEDKKCCNSPYEDISPNRLEDYISLFNHRQQKASKYDQLQQQKQREDEPLKSIKVIRHNSKKNTTFIEENHFSTEDLLSAKLRIKANHKKMIEICKAKTK